MYLRKRQRQRKIVAVSLTVIAKSASKYAYFTDFCSKLHRGLLDSKEVRITPNQCWYHFNPFRIFVAKV